MYLFEANFANGGNVDINLKDADGRVIENLASFNSIFDAYLTKSVKTRTNQEKVIAWFNSNFKNWLKNEAKGYDDHNSFTPEKKFRSALYPKFTEVLEDLQDEFDDMSEEEIVAAFPEYIRNDRENAMIFAGGRRLTRLPSVTQKLTGELIDYLNAVAINQEERNYQLMPDNYFVRDLTKLSPVDAIENAYSYHVYLERQKDKLSKEQSKQMYRALKEGKDFEVVKKFPDGSRIVRALNSAYTDCEGKTMGHCVATYGSQVNNKSVIILSMQDEEGLPVATLELSSDEKTIKQLKGPKNGPVKPEFHKKIVEFIKDNKMKFVSSGYGSSDYRFIGLDSPDLSKAKLDENFEVADDEDDQPKPTKTKQSFKSSFQNMNFGDRNDKLPGLRKDDEKSDKKDGWQEKAMKLNQASKGQTDDAMKDVQLDRQSILYFMNMDLSGLTDEIPEPSTDVSVPQYDVTKPKSANLPAIMGNALKVAGMQNPDWHMVKNLPGYMSAGIRAIGRQVFAPFTSTKIEDIQVIASLGGRGPNTTAEINAVANFLVKFGTKSTDASMEFSERIPGYKAEMKIYTFANYTFLLVQDHAGNYIYAWPSTDNKMSIEDESMKLK